MKNFLKLLFLLFISTLIINIHKGKTQNMSALYGITLSGAEFGEKYLPGVYNIHYTYPMVSEIEYFAKKGTQIIQLPFKWERIQHSIGGPLDQQELTLISKFIDDCEQKNVLVTLVLQNFGRYNLNGIDYIVGSKEVPSSALRDVWKKIAFAMRKKINIFAFSIMSEPHDMDNYNWSYSAQQAIFGIREVDQKSVILVDGENYSNPETWVQYNNQLKYLIDPSNNMMYNSHCYFDEDRSGKYQQPYELSGANEMTGVERVKPFIEWLKINNKKGFVGEFGVPKTDTRWLRVLDNFLNYLYEQKVGGCYWAAGSWWKDYPLSIEPTNNLDQPQMIVYLKYFQNNTLMSNKKGLRKTEVLASIR